ncbi:MAG: TrmH family RNA methyltransferase, partial [Rhabdochlamydiaceae bacterium]
QKRIDEARVFASHGKHIIDEMERVGSLDELKKKFRLLIGTTAIEATRKSNLTRKTLEVEACALKVAARIARNPRSSCIIFGRDTTGMTNEELKKCDYNVTIRTGSDYSTLNVSHAAAIILYVFSKHLGKTTSQQKKVVGRYSSRAERERAILLFEKLARDSEFQYFKSGLLREALSRLFERGDPSLREAYLLMGLASKASSKIQRLSAR